MKNEKELTKEQRFTAFIILTGMFLLLIAIILGIIQEANILHI